MAYSLTYRDVINSVRSWLGGNATREAHVGIVQPIKSALREITSFRKWTYLRTQGRIYLNEGFSEGTVTYDKASRVLTLTDGTWPEWSEDSDVRMADVLHRVVARNSDTQLVLDKVLSPNNDIVDDTPFLQAKRIYVLPEDFSETDVMLLQFNLWTVSWVPPRDWLIQQRYVSSTGPPDKFTIMGHPRLINRMALMIEPASGQDDSLDFIYQRNPRELVITGYEASHYAGTVENSATPYSIDGTNTEFDGSMVGSMIRVSYSKKIPGQDTGPVPYMFEARITDVQSNSLITVDADPPEFSDKAYVVSDPVDIDPVMTEAYLRCCEKQVGIHRRTKNVKELDALFRDAMARAEAADSKAYVPRVVGEGSTYIRSLSNYPGGSDQP